MKSMLESMIIVDEFAVIASAKHGSLLLKVQLSSIPYSVGTGAEVTLLIGSTPAPEPRCHLPKWPVAYPAFCKIDVTVGVSVGRKFDWPCCWLTVQLWFSAVSIRNCDGPRPVINPVRDGEHTGFATWKSTKSVPRAAMRFRFGVWFGSTPVPPTSA